MSNFEPPNALIFVIVCMITSPLIFYLMKTKAPKQPVVSKSNFEVVDTYKGCDVLKWGNGNLAEYKYLLYCKGGNK
jgi:hypothetical protein